MFAGSNATTEIFEIAKGQHGIMQTLKVMRSMTDRYKTNIRIREIAQRIINDVEQKDWIEEARTLQDWVRENVRYTRDVSGVETVATPDHTLFTRHGDCDDQSILMATLLESVGHPARFVAVGPQPRRFSHVYVETYIEGKWWPVETTENWEFGEGPPVVKSKLILDTASIKNNAVNGIGKKKVINFAQAERDLDNELDNIMGINDQLDRYDDGLGFHKKFKKRLKRLKKITKKVVKVAAVAAAVYFTGGAALGPMMALADKKRQMKAMEAENAVIEKEQAAYDAEMAQQQALAEKNANAMLAKRGIKMGSPQAKAYLSKAIKLERDKLSVGISPGGGFKKILPLLIGVPLIAYIAMSRG